MHAKPDSIDGFESLIREGADRRIKNMSAGVNEGNPGPAIMEELLYPSRRADSAPKVWLQSVAGRLAQWLDKGLPPMQLLDMDVLRADAMAFTGGSFQERPDSTQAFTTDVQRVSRTLQSLSAYPFISPDLAKQMSTVRGLAELCLERGVPIGWDSITGFLTSGVSFTGKPGLDLLVSDAQRILCTVGLSHPQDMGEGNVSTQWHPGHLGIPQTQLGEVALVRSLGGPSHPVAQSYLRGFVGAHDWWHKRGKLPILPLEPEPVSEPENDDRKVERTVVPQVPDEGYYRQVPDDYYVSSPAQKGHAPRVQGALPIGDIWLSSRAPNGERRTCYRGGSPFDPDKD